MSKPFAACLIWSLALGVGAPAQAAQDIDQVLPVDRTGVVRIHNPRGKLRVHGWDRAEVKVEGNVDDLAETVRFEVVGKRTVLHVGVPKRNTNWGDGSDLEVWMPVESGLVVDAVSTNVRVREVAGSMLIRTVGGDVEVTDISGRTRIKTVSGDVEVIDGTGRLSVASTSGDLDIRAQVEDIVVDTMTGDIDLRLAAFDRLHAQTVKGALEVAGQLNRNGILQAQTVHSGIEVEFQEPVNAKIHARTFAGGEIHNELTDDRPQRVGGNLHLRTVAGDGSADVVLHSVNGEIEIE